jgi:4-amino-4-deoxy-L-arabinose transferase-like glycosyltransferase
MLFLGIIKYKHFILPFYWDEAWSYAVAVYEMTNNISTILPFQVDQDVYRGHPLFFYFITSITAKISGFSPFNLHIIMYAMSCIFLIILFRASSKWFNQSTAFTICFFILFQEIYIIQSSLLLPEIMIAFLSIISMYCVIQKNYLLYFIYGSMLVLTKESGIVAILSSCLINLLNPLFNKLSLRQYFKELLLATLPLLVFILFLIIQKLKWGWYFYPDHIGLIDVRPDKIFAYIKDILKIVFINKFNYLFSIIIIIISFFYNLIVSPDNFKKIIKNKTFWLILIFTLTYILFSAINFYTSRYLIPLFFILAIIIGISIKSIKTTRVSILLINGLIFLAQLTIYNTNNNFNNGDCEKHYIDAVQVEKSAFDDFVTKNTDSTFGADFLTDFNLRFNYLGYVNNGLKLNVKSYSEARFIIATSNSPLTDYIKSMNNNLVLMYTKSQNNAWCRIYKRIN